MKANCFILFFVVLYFFRKSQDVTFKVRWGITAEGGGGRKKDAPMNNRNNWKNCLTSGSWKEQWMQFMGLHKEPMFSEQPPHFFYGEAPFTFRQSPLIIGTVVLYQAFTIFFNERLIFFKLVCLSRWGKNGDSFSSLALSMNPEERKTYLKFHDYYLIFWGFS